MDPNMAGMPQGEHPHMIGVPSGLPTLQSMSGQELEMEGEGNGEDHPGKFKPINLERLSPKYDPARLVLHAGGDILSQINTVDSIY